MRLMTPLELGLSGFNPSCRNRRDQATVQNHIYYRAYRSGVFHSRSVARKYSTTSVRRPAPPQPVTATRARTRRFSPAPIQTIHSATLLRSKCIDLIGNIISGVLPRNDLKARSLQTFLNQLPRAEEFAIAAFSAKIVARNAEGSNKGERLRHSLDREGLPAFNVHLQKIDS